MKRKLALLLALVLLLSMFTVACGKDKEPVDVEGPKDVEEPDEEAKEPSEPMGEVTIGNSTELSGDWIPYWSNIASDNDIYNFITGYGTVETTFDGEFVINETAVENLEITENEDGSKTYTWTIKDGLTYDDGTPITAKDYVASIMLWSSSVVGEMGAENSYGYYLKGWPQFAKGESKVFPGVNLIDDKTFATTISEEHVPYFYELNAASAVPTKLDYWVGDDVEILDDGEGCYFSENFTLENCKEKIEKARFGIYPSSGPYVLESYDESNKVAVLKVNDKFLGNYEGRKPLIETVIYKKITDETAIDELSTGGVDILYGINSGEVINAGLDLVDKGGYDCFDYPRSGYGKLVFHCDHGPTESPKVRQAIAHLLDRNDFAKAFTGGFGAVVHGPYGEAMWFFQETKAELDKKINQYPYSLESAIELLEEDGWVYDENGGEYKEGIRYKKTEDGKLMPLIIEWASTEDNEVSDLLVVKLQENPDVAAAGMKINQTTMDFPDLVAYLIRDGSQGERYGVPTYHMFNLATNYSAVYDLSTSYTTDPDLIKQGANENFIIDEELENLAISMVKRDPEDKEGFKQAFVDFIAKWNELLPDLPLYSNIYYDFYNDKIENYKRTDLVRIVDTILYAYVTE